MSFRKRSYHQEPEEVTDDLEIAAQYAMPTYLMPTPTTTTEAEAVRTEAHLPPEEDENEISLDDDDNDENDSEPVLPNEIRDKPTEEDTSSTTTDDDEEEEDEFDLEHDLEQMTATRDAIQPPRTAHEVDLYTVPTEQLERALNLKLNVDETCFKNAKHNNVKLQRAGTLKHCLAGCERTILVQSAVGSLLLQEGTILWMQRGGENVPLGPILEVFGPVSQPLYSIRLPDARKENNNKDALDTSTTTTTTATDRWASDGEYMQFLLSNSGVSIFYQSEAAQLLDPNEVLRATGKGCDASNIYDEEVDEQEYYSDDEQERAAKGKRRRQRKPQGNTVTTANATRTTATTTPQGFYQPAIPTQAALQPPPPPPTPAQQTEESDTVYYDYP